MVLPKLILYLLQDGFNETSNNRVFETFRPDFGGTLDVEGCSGRGLSMSLYLGFQTRS